MKKFFMSLLFFVVIATVGVSSIALFGTSCDTQTEPVPPPVTVPDAQESQPEDVRIDDVIMDVEIDEDLVIKTEYIVMDPMVFHTSL